MTNARPILGDDVAIDVDRLLVTKLLVQANSGGGKSYAIRRLLEQTFGRLQHIVIDPEGEFHTLRERFEYALAGKGGEAVANLKTADLLAPRLLELGVSTIVDISELGVDKPAFVAKFLDALVNSPRELWHPVLVVVDEAHRFCPEQGKVGKAKAKEERKAIEESKAAVITLMDSGRKRGFCGVLATQRVSKLNKDATAECNNKLIGRSVEIDAKRAAEELGLASRDAMQQMRKLQPGHFFVFGPAFCDEIRTVRVGPVVTTHPEAGKAAPPPTPPRGKVREVLGKLAGLAAEAEQEEREIEQMRMRNAELERAVRDLKTTNDTLGRHAAEQESRARQIQTAEKKVPVPTPVLTGGELDNLKTLVRSADEIMRQGVQTFGDLGVALIDIKSAIEIAGVPDFLERVERAKLRPEPGAKVGDQVRGRAVVGGRPTQATQRVTAGETAPSGARRTTALHPDAAKLEPRLVKLLAAIAWWDTIGIDDPSSTMVAYLAGTSPISSGFEKSRGQLRTLGLIDYPTPGTVRLTDAGRKIAPRTQTPLTTQDLHDAILQKLDPRHGRMLKPLIDAYPDSLTTEDLADAAGTSATSSGFEKTRGQLRSWGLADYPRAGYVRASDLLFPEGA